MAKKNKTRRYLKVFSPFVLSILTLLLSSFLSWRISYSSVKKTAINESKRELLVRESAVLNKVMDIAKESKLVCVGYINEKHIHEIHITSFITKDSVVVYNDTTYNDYPKVDTTFCYIPRFVFYPESNEKVQNCLSFIEQHFDDLGLRTYEQVSRLVRFTKRIPIIMIEDDNFADNRWSDLKVVNDFNEIIDEINQSYLERLAEFGLY